MTSQTARRLLVLASLVCVVAALTVMFRTLRFRPRTDPVTLPSATLSQESIQDQPSTKFMLTEEHFKFIWGKRLQRPVKTVQSPIQPVPNPVVQTRRPAAVESPRPLQAKLLGTLVDQDIRFARAWVVVKGHPIVVSVGDELEHHPGNPIVDSIQSDRIVLRFNGTLRNLQLDTRNVFSDELVTASGD